MKTRRKKIICKIISFLACVLFCASFFCIPVSAATVTKVTFQPPMPGFADEMNFFRVSLGTPSNFTLLSDNNWSSLYSPTTISWIGGNSNPQGVIYSFNKPNASSNTGVVSFWLGQSKFGLTSYSSSDIVYLNAGTFKLLLDSGSANRLQGYRFSLRAINSDGSIGKVVAYTDLFSPILIAGPATEKTISYPQLSFTFSQSVTSSGLALCLDVGVLFNHTSGTTYSAGISATSSFTVVYSNGPDPNLPTYTPPDQGGVGDLDNTEGELLDGSQEGMDVATDFFSDLSGNLSSYATAFVRISEILNRLVGSVPLFGVLVSISLTLGLFTSLLGLAGSIVSAADRRAGREAREAARRDNKRK